MYILKYKIIIGDGFPTNVIRVNGLDIFVSGNPNEVI